MKSVLNPIVDLPNVGRNLREHRTLSTSYRLHSGGFNDSLRGLGMAKSILRYLLLRDGVMASSIFSMSGFVKTMPDLDWPDCQIGIGLMSFGNKGEVEAKPGFTMFGYYLRPESQGELAIQSANPSVPPRINANYMATPADRQHNVALLRHMRRIAAQPALAPHIVEEVRPGANYQSDAELLEAAINYGTSGYHVAGTCRMGSDDGAVLDPQLRVRGVEGLRVVDTSIMPDLVSGNTNGPAMAIAWRTAELIRG